MTISPTACHRCGRIINSTVKGITVCATRSLPPYHTYCEACVYNFKERRHSIEKGLAKEFDGVVSYAQSRIGYSGTHSIDI